MKTNPAFCETLAFPIFRSKIKTYISLNSDETPALSSPYALLGNIPARAARLDPQCKIRGERERGEREREREGEGLLEGGGGECRSD